MDVTKKEEEFNLREIIKPYTKRWYWFFGSVILTTILAILYIKFTTPVYKIQSSVLIKDAKKMSSASGDFGVLAGLGGFAGMGTNSIENELEIFKSKRIIEDVTKNLKLQVSIYSREKYHDVELYNDTNPFIVHVVNEKQFEELPKKPIDVKIQGDKITLSSEELKKDVITTFNKTISLPYANFIIQKNPKFNRKKVKKLDLNDFYFTYSDFASVVDDYQKALEVDLMDKDATVIGLGIAHSNKDKSKDILNNLVDIYNEYAIKDKNTESKKTKDFIDERIVLISKELGEVESDKERFKVDNDIVDIQTEAKINLQTSNETRRKSLEIETQIEVSRMLLGFIDSSSNQVLPTNIGLDNPTATSNITAYNKLIMDRNRLLENATTENPLVKEVTKDISGLKNAMRESIQRYLINLNATKNQINRENNYSNTEIQKVPRQEKLFRNIERQQQIKENLYLLLLQKREEAAISMAMTDNKARVVDHAYVLKKPVAPKKMISVLGAWILGLLIPFGFIYIKELLNNKLISKHDLEKRTSTPILSEIPRLYRKDGEIITKNDVSPLAESFRILVTNLNFMLSKKSEAKIIFVTSTIKGEGKTFVSVNLSLALASSTKRVLVIGSDIRNPQLQRYNPAMKNTKGLSEYLYEEIDSPKEIIHPSNFHPNCDFIYSGVIPPNPTDLLQNGRYSLLLDSLKNDYDYIILDTAPLMLVTDSFLISEVADATVYVTRSEITEKGFIDFANKNIETKKIKNVAFVLNDVHKSNFGYGNKYGYGYQAEEKKWWQKIF
ncbi:GumC family protein [Epilithonimonas arachidiradicis]|uniref:non-specific protein-tyrosine kinase n=1 Tax=Epilithonimonas arachidiradicis TaxID=1617282 RepID=A0A420DCI9_9FLAO|nr:tyrosine-protein kinase [Epilithonimonas arachidiradicis]RKE89005.1 capsular exopolysaccharide synthesis family protein [Epilithonimonas arachidiradicis]GGG53320.1 tyrosine protein kinase [Epilithonimonas arachidiradicis]